MHLSTRGSTRRRSRRRPPVLVRPWERSVERERRRAFYRARTDPDPGRQLLLPEHAPPPGGEFLHPTRRNSRPVAPGLWVGSPLALADEAGEFDVVVDVTGRKAPWRSRHVELAPRCRRRGWRARDYDRLVASTARTLLAGGEVLLVEPEGARGQPGALAAAAVLLALGEARDPSDALDQALRRDCPPDGSHLVGMTAWWQERERRLARIRTAWRARAQRRRSAGLASGRLAPPWLDPRQRPRRHGSFPVGLPRLGGGGGRQPVSASNPGSEVLVPEAERVAGLGTWPLGEEPEGRLIEDLAEQVEARLESSPRDWAWWKTRERRLRDDMAQVIEEAVTSPPPWGWLRRSTPADLSGELDSPREGMPPPKETHVWYPNLGERVNEVMSSPFHDWPWPLIPFPYTTEGLGERLAEGLESALGDWTTGDEETKPLGLNMTRTLVSEELGQTRYGVIDSQMLDFATLGATALRQVGQPDLLWKNLPVAGASNELERYPGSGPPIPAAYADILALLTDRNGNGGTSFLSNLALTLVKALASGQRLCLTFLALGASGSAAPDEALAHGWRVTSPLQADWAAGSHAHALTRRELEALDLGFVADLLGMTSTTRLRNDRTGCLMPQDDYHLARIATIATAFAAVLRAVLDLMALLLPGFSPRDVVERIELFNEVEDSAVVVDAVGQVVQRHLGEGWGRACYVAARVFKRELPDLPVFLPGITSYGVGPVPPTDAEYTVSWAGRKEFLAALLRHLGACCGRGYGASTGDPDPAIEELIDGVDYHFYHREPASSGGPRTALGPLDIRRLLSEVDEIQAILGAGGVADPLVSVMESGVSSDPGVDFLPASVPDAQEFQAREVIRRLAGTLASQACMAGWHCFVPGAGSSDWGGTGLREEGLSPLAEAEGAEQKPSWYAFWRLARYLGTVVDGRSIKPVPVTGRSIPPDLVVFEYRRVSRTQPWAYLVMFDPTWERASWATLTPLTRGAPARITEVALEPSTDTPETTLVAGDIDVFQLEDPASLTYPAPTSPSTVTVRWTGWPRLFLSHDPVTWRLDDEGSGVSGAARSERLSP